MNLLRLAAKSVWNRRLTAALVVLSIAIGVALLLGVERLRTQARASFSQTLTGTDLIVGARGGPVNLLLYSVFRIGDATNNIKWRTVEALASWPDVAWQVPLSLGDSHRGYRVLGFLATAPLAIPGIVLGVGLFLAYTRPPLALYGTLWILLIAFVTIELPAAYQQLGSAFHAVHPELEEAGRMLGATRLRTLADITAPLLRSAVIATWCFIFVATIRELSAAVILFTSETKVLSVLIFDLKESGDVGAIAVLSLTMVAITTIVIAAANRLHARPQMRPA